MHALYSPVVIPRDHINSRLRLYICAYTLALERTFMMIFMMMDGQMWGGLQSISLISLWEGKVETITK
jgi:hypothetical protein